MIDAHVLQAHLTLAGEDFGATDGVLGPMTIGAFLNVVAGRVVDPVLAHGMADFWPGAQIDRPLRICHFVAQAAHETMGFRLLIEEGGPAYCARYDGRRDLGNTQPGDGYRFRGRGVFQLTGRANYTRYAQALGLDLINNPDLAAEPEISAETACRFWSDCNLNAYADLDAIQTITRRINGGLNGLADRAAYLVKAKQLWGLR